MFLVKDMGKSNFYSKNYKHLCVSNDSNFIYFIFLLSTQFPIVIDEVPLQFDIELFIILFLNKAEGEV